MNQVKELVKKLTETYGPSGHEEKIAQIIREEVGPFVDEMRTDALGNLICYKKATLGHNPAGRRVKKVMFSAHMDQIGLVVTFIDDSGFLRFSNVGGVKPYIISSQRVVFENGVKGVVNFEKAEDAKDAKMSKMFIDIGASSKEEAEKLVKIGDCAVYDTRFDDAGDKLISKAMDNRASCAALVEAIKRMKPSCNDMYFVFSTQEELGVRGARAASFSVNPDIGIACDVTGWGDSPNVEPFSVSLGKGVAVKVKDASVIAHPKVKEAMVKVCEEKKLAYQFEVLEWGGTDAGAMSLNMAGVPSGAVSIPCRYVHTPSEMIDVNDLEAAIELIVGLISEPFDFEC